MQIGFINSIATWWLNKRLSDLRLFIKNPLNTQEEQLRNLIIKGQKTKYGQTHNFTAIHNYESFVEQVPLNNYDTLSTDIKKMIDGEEDILWPGQVKWFAKSSGTTGTRSKFIPVTQDVLQLTHYQGTKDVLAYYLHHHPESKLLKGKTLKLGGSKKLHQKGQAYIGDLSAIMIDQMPYWTNLVTVPEKKTALLADWEEKLDKIIQKALKSHLTGLAGVPSWMMLFLQEALHQTGKKNVLEIWPDLEVFFHGGVSFEPYKKAYEQFFPSDKFHYMETYNASEGFFALQDSPEKSDMLLMLDYGIFYEFIPVSGFNELNSTQILPLHKVKTGVNYAMVISTTGGLWRYIIGDTIRFTSTKPYRIKITGRTKHYINAFGEEVVIEQADRALSKAAQETGAIIKEYTVAPKYMSTRQKGTHEWLIEFEKLPQNIEKFAYLLDRNLQKLNSDYEAKRTKNITMEPPIINVAPVGLFYKWLEQNGKLGGQNKVPRLLNNRKVIESLLNLNS